MPGENKHLRDPEAISWEDLRAEFNFSEEEEADIAHRGEQLLARVRAHRLAEIRKRKHVTQVEVADDMGITQARVSKIERGDISRSEVDTLASYVRALGGEAAARRQFRGRELRNRLTPAYAATTCTVYRR